MRVAPPVRPSVRFVPALMVAVAMLTTSFGTLADQPAILVPALVALGVLVGVTEGSWLRGIGATAFRPDGIRGGHVARVRGSRVVAPAEHLRAKGRRPSRRR